MTTASYVPPPVTDRQFVAGPHWSTKQALSQLRSAYAGTASFADLEPVLTWIRRDLTGGSRRLVDPEDLYRQIAATGVGEACFTSGVAGMGQQGYTHDEIAWAGKSASRYVGLGCVWRAVETKGTSNVIDLGRGSGADLAIAERQAGRSSVVGIDLRRHLLGFSATSAAQADARSLPFRQEGFELAIANGLPPVLRANDSTRAVLKETRRVLRPGGSLVFSTLTFGGDIRLDHLSDLDLLGAARSGKPLCAEYRRLVAEAGFARCQFQETATPLVPAIDPGAVKAMLVTCTRG